MKTPLRITGATRSVFGINGSLPRFECGVTVFAVVAATARFMKNVGTNIPVAAAGANIGNAFGWLC